MDTTVDALLDAAPRCLLALRGRRGPLLVPMVFWADGRHVWMTTAAATAKVRALRRDPRCRAYVAPQDGRHGAVIEGRVRIHGIGDPVGLVLHGPMISTAMAALAVKQAPTIVGYAQDVPRIPPAWLPRNRVALRLEIEQTRLVEVPDLGPGVAPPLPTVVPSDVRRALAGVRRVVVATDDAVMAAVWGPGYRLRTAPGHRLPADAPAAVTVDAEPRARPSEFVGLSLCGRVTDGLLQPERATWWHGFAAETVDVPAVTAAIQLPD